MLLLQPLLQLVALLRERHPERRWDWVNTGVPGYNTAMQVATLRERALVFEPDLVLLSLVVVGPKTLWGLIGLVPLLTGLAGSCPLYSLFGLNTCNIGTSR